MRIIRFIRSGVMVPFLAAMSACALDGTPSESQDLNDAPASSEHGDAAATSSDAAEIDVLSTPTCNWVASYAGAWVPMYTGTNTVDCNMVVGCVSEGVKKLQHSMNLCYLEHLDEDGNFGTLTRDALIRTQRKAGTTADGQYGPNTRKAMFHQAISGGCIRVP